MKKPLVFIGTNSNLFKLAELVIRAGYSLAGIIDDDYYGQESFKGLPVIGDEATLRAKAEFYKQKYQFICATNWVPDDYEIAERNRAKRQRQLELMQQLELDVATIVAPTAIVSRLSQLGPGTVVFDFATVEPQVSVGSNTLIYDYAIVGHESVIGNNVVLQRYCLVTSLVTVEDNVYMGLGSRVSRSDVVVSKNTFIHPDLTLLRGTLPNEHVSLAGHDLRKVYHKVEVHK